jgi:hypothetical protein
MKERNCKNCFYHVTGDRCDLEGHEGGGHDEYNHCAGWQPWKVAMKHPEEFLRLYSDYYVYDKWTASAGGEQVPGTFSGTFDEAAQKAREATGQKVEVYHYEDRVYVNRERLSMRDNESRIVELFNAGHCIEARPVGCYGRSRGDLIKPIWGSSKRIDRSNPMGTENFGYVFMAECLETGA